MIWVANEGEGASITLTWEIPIQIKEIVLYGISANRMAGTNIHVQDSKIVLYYNSNEVRTVSSTGRIRPEGTYVVLPKTLIDSAKIVVTKFFGTVYHRHLAGLAEVETIARIR